VTSDGVVTTLAGAAGESGSADGTNSTARFNGPYGVAVDGAGNVYVTDSGNHTVRKITSDGVVTTLAGSVGESGSADGTNSAARFFAPAGIAVDGAGNLYTADIGNSTIRKVTSSGTVTTLAGSAGQVGSADGTGSEARFLAATGITVDSSGNLFVADSGNSTIRKVTSGGTVTTFAGKAGEVGSDDVVPEQARFFIPYGLAVDIAGNLFVADTYNSSIRKVTSDGAVTTLAGLSEHPGSANGTGDTARFSYPFGLATDTAGNIYVADSYNNMIRKVTSAGVVTTLAGSAGQPGSADGTGSAARFSYPSGVAVDSAGNIFVTDFDNSTLRKVTGGGVVTTLAGSPGEIGSTDGTGNTARFGHPNGVAVDSAGNLYVADSGNSTLRKVTSGGVVTTLAGSAGQRGGIDGTNSGARFDYPFGVVVDSSGNIYLADAGNSTIRKVTSDGMVTTIGGLAGVMGGEDGIGHMATFAGPGGIALDSSGRLYVADAGNNRISRGIRVPVLSIASSGVNLIVSWHSPSIGFALQQSSDVNNSNGWSMSPYAVSDDGTNKSVVIAPLVENQFFRLIAND
jgi:sugar lactone lactonase YvrE